MAMTNIPLLEAVSFPNVILCSGLKMMKRFAEIQSSLFLMRAACSAAYN
jgi:hypothetical protein